MHARARPTECAGLDFSPSRDGERRQKRIDRMALEHVATDTLGHHTPAQQEVAIGGGGGSEGDVQLRSRRSGWCPHLHRLGILSGVSVVLHAGH